MKKIAILTLAVALVLASLGVGFAKWFDRITIEGTVETGNLDLVVEDYSCTYVYKDLEHQYPEKWNGGFACIVSGEPLEMEGLELIGSACAEQAVDEAGEPIDDAVTMTFDNLFPNLNDAGQRMFRWKADVLVHYAGSIPARLYIDPATMEFPEGSEWLAEYMTVHIYDPELGVEEGTIDNCTQVHYCDLIQIDVKIDIPEDEELMLKSGSFTWSFDAVQWNETADCGATD